MSSQARDDGLVDDDGECGPSGVEIIDAAAEPVISLTSLVASVEPSVVFGSLAALCVPDLCDHCTIDIVDGSHARYRIAYPPPATRTGGLLRLADRAGTSPIHRVRVPFAHPSPTPAMRGRPQPSDLRDEFRGVATFVWHLRVPTRSDHIAASVLVDRAVQTVVWQRSEEAAGAAAVDVANLELALRTSRRIGAAVGILMSVYKIANDDAFNLLVQASHRSNRKLRDLADDVIDTGWLDPALLPTNANGSITP